MKQNIIHNNLTLSCKIITLADCEDTSSCMHTVNSVSQVNYVRKFELLYSPFLFNLVQRVHMSSNSAADILGYHMDQFQCCDSTLGSCQ